ncbi:MAG: PKD domain-containing protein, partial [Nanoarchaeota archaeon]|nr:PKD domain-containing protein [Nanoarchaeota archaeon]
MRCKTLLVLLLVFVVGVAGFVSGATVENSSLVTDYVDAVYLSGWLNLSLEDEAFDSEFIVKVGGVEYRKELVDLFNESGLNYSCNPEGCGEDYVESLPESAKSFSLDEEKTVGIIVEGKNLDIELFKFNVVSDAVASCEMQLSIDILDDKKINWINDDSISQNCGSVVTSDCVKPFNSNMLLDWTPYCNKIKLPVAPSFKIEAGIQKTGGSYFPGILIARIYNKFGEEKGSCDLSQPLNGKSSCIIQYSNKEEEDYFVCVSLKNGESSEAYRLGGSLAENCGFHGNPNAFPEFVANYNLKVYAQKYSAVGSFILDKITFLQQNSLSLDDYLEEYLASKYSNDCSQKCIFPLKFSGGVQTVSISGLDLRYNAQGGSGLKEVNFYELTKTPAKINSDFVKLNLNELNFSLPQSSGNYTLEFFIDDEKILTKEILITQSFVIDPNSDVRQIYPKTVAVANPTLFTVFINPNLNKSGLKYKWYFGEGIPITTDINQVEYTYSSLGDYFVEVSLMSQGEKITGNRFKIIAESPKQAINKTLEEYGRSLDKVGSQLSGLPEDYKVLFDDYLSLDDVKLRLANFKDKYKQFAESGGSDKDYIGLMEGLVGLKIPLSIQPSVITNSEFIFNPDKIKLSEVDDLFDDKSKDSEAEVINQIVLWLNDNIDAEFKSQTWSIYFSDLREDIFTDFVINVNSKDTNSRGYFIIDEDKEDLIFVGDYEFSSEDYGEITGMGVDFSDDFEINFAKVGASTVGDFYFVPEFKNLGRSNNELGDGNKDNTLLILIGVFTGLF